MLGLVVHWRPSFAGAERKLNRRKMRISKRGIDKIDMVMENDRDLGGNGAIQVHVVYLLALSLCELERESEIV